MSRNNTFLNSKYASSFSPTNLRGLAVWLNANDSNSITQSAGVVSSWIDRTPNAYNMSQATVGNRPTVESNVRNGNSALRFTTTQALTSTTTVALTSDATWFLVVNPLAAGNLFFIEQGTDTNTFPGTYIYGGNNYFFYTTRGGFGRQFIDASATPFPLSNWYVITAMFSNRSTAVTDYYWAYNGIRRSGTTGALISVSSVSSNLYINPLARVPGSNYMGELIIYNRPLTYGEIYGVERYLADKWAVPLQAPHPYTSVPSALRLFNPLDICGLSVWIDAADRRKIDVSATLNRVTSISNKAVPTQDFSINPTGTVNYITYTAIDNRGYPALTLPGGQRYITNRTDLSRAVFFSDSCTCTVFAAWDICGTTTGTNAAAFGAFGVVSTTTIRAAIFFTGSTGTGFWQAGTSTGATVSMAAQALGTPRVQAFRRNGLEMIYRNFGTQTTSNNATTAPTIQSNTLYRFDITAQANVGGKIYEILWYNRALADTEVNAVEVYLAEKWGLRSSLTTGVPPRFTRALSPVFNPVLLSNCVLWLDAADFSTLTLTGTSNVTGWRDKSGLANNATAPTASYPIYQSNTSTLCNQPTISFIGTSNVLTVASNYTTTAYPSLCYFIVIRPASTQTTTAGILSTDSAGAYGRSLGFNAGNWQQEYYSNFTNITPYTSNVWTIVSLQFTGTTSATLAVNGTAFAGTASGTGNNTSGLTIGSYNSTGTYATFKANFETAEILIYGANIPLAERQRIEGYLAEKWNLLGNLANSHPYKTTTLV